MWAAFSYKIYTMHIVYLTHLVRRVAADLAADTECQCHRCPNRSRSQPVQIVRVYARSRR